MQPSATRCAVSLQSADFWRKYHVTIFLDLRNFLDFGKILELATIFDFRECYL